MTNIAELLKDCPKGTKLYSPLFGEVEYMQLGDENKIWVKTSCDTYYFDKHGKPYAFDKAECLLFPSKEVRTWEGWLLHKSHYDIANFKPKQWVLVRDDDEWEWALTRFSYLSNGSASLFVCINGASFQQCIPYEGNEHLLGTTDMCPEEYVNW